MSTDLSERGTDERCDIGSASAASHVARPDVDRRGRLARRQTEASELGGRHARAELGRWHTWVERQDSRCSGDEIKGSSYP